MSDIDPFGEIVLVQKASESINPEITIDVKNRYMSVLGSTVV